MDKYQVILILKDNKHTESFTNEAEAKAYMEYVKSLFKQDIVSVKIEEKKEDL